MISRDDTSDAPINLWSESAKLSKSTVPKALAREEQRNRRQRAPVILPT
jgi:hypothetical protein